MPFTRANPPTADNPSGAMNTISAPDPDTGGNPNTGSDPDTGGDLAAAIALLAQTLAAQNVRPPPAPHASAALVTSPTRLREPDTFDSSDANKLQVFILQCSLHFQDCTNAFSTGRAKVVYALSYLMGPALSWFKPGLFALSLPAWVHHWDLFHTELESNFGPFNPVGKAEAKIETLVMAEGSCSAMYFVSPSVPHTVGQPHPPPTSLQRPSLPYQKQDGAPQSACYLAGYP